MAELSREAFIKQFSEVIEQWPLYRKWVFEGNVLEKRRGFVDDYVPMPETIHLPCDRCQLKTRWRGACVGGSAHIIPSDLTQQLVYICQNCSGEYSGAHYIVSSEISMKGGWIMKIGQHPPLEHAPAQQMSAVLDAGDVKLYKQALTCRNFNYGIAAVAYLRRIVEDNLEKVLDLIYEELTRANGDSLGLRQQFDAAKANHSFTERLDFAIEHARTIFIIQNQNPLKQLHRLTSNGLHTLTDDECILIFDRCRLAFEYVIRHLYEEKARASEFSKAMKELHG